MFDQKAWFMDIPVGKNLYADILILNLYQHFQKIKDPKVLKSKSSNIHRCVNVPSCRFWPEIPFPTPIRSKP